MTPFNPFLIIIPILSKIGSTFNLFSRFIKDDILYLIIARFI